MVTKKIKELEVTKAKVAALEKSIEKTLARELSSLHEEYGFDSLAAFIKALRSVTGVKGKRRGRPAKSAASKARRKRSVITEETRAEVKKLIDGGKTGGQIAKTLGISVPSVQNIKKALGLVKARA